MSFFNVETLKGTSFIDCVSASIWVYKLATLSSNMLSKQLFFSLTSVFQTQKQKVESVYQWLEGEGNGEVFNRLAVW